MQSSRKIKKHKTTQNESIHPFAHPEGDRAIHDGQACQQDPIGGSADAMFGKAHSRSRRRTTAI